jgi:hypothetical protein
MPEKRKSAAASIGASQEIPSKAAHKAPSRPDQKAHDDKTADLTKQIDSLKEQVVRIITTKAHPERMELLKDENPRTNQRR